MRKIQSAQIQLGEIDVRAIKIELDNRDEIPQLLRGLQHIYTTPKVRNQIFDLLFTLVADKIDVTVGREGMPLWRILVLGTLRLCCGWDYDKLQEIANNHHTLRQMLGHGVLDFKERYCRQTLNDNLRLFTPEVLDKINVIVVKEGLSILGKENKDQAGQARCDSFVLETDVHFPTDINLLWDALRVVIRTCYKMTKGGSGAGWRQASHLFKKMKGLYRKVQRERESDKESSGCLKATQEYIDEAMVLLQRGEDTAEALMKGGSIVATAQGIKIKEFAAAGKKQIDQIVRRVFKGETIPHAEKVFSLFEPHTEWISKGKAGVPQELGVRVCIMESGTQFILHHQVMEQKTDDAVAVEMVKETIERYRGIKSCSFDKGFYTPENKKTLEGMLTCSVLPKKGGLNKTEALWENSEEFTSKRRKHSAVESAINALEQHGLDRCRDYGMEGFKRYVSLAIVARNIQLIGALLRDRELSALNR
jgi:hypothetical protein